MPIPMRRYTAEQKADAVGLSMSVGVLEAARRLGIPHRNISAWRVHPDFQSIVASHRVELARRLNEAYTLALEEVMQGLRNPKALLGHKAKALEVLGNQRALISGEATARTESANLTLTAPVEVPPPLLTDHEMLLLDRYVSLLEAGQAPALHERIKETEDVG